MKYPTSFKKQRCRDQKKKTCTSSHVKRHRLFRHFIPIMRLLPPRCRPPRHNSIRIQQRMTCEIVCFNVMDVNALRNSRSLIQIANVLLECGVLSDAFAICFEVDDVHGIKSNQSDEQSDVCFSEDITGDETTFG